MNEPAFIDVNIPMYAGGAEHPNKEPALRVLRRIAHREIEAVTDAEVFQEILHRYRAIDRLKDGLAIYDAFRAVVQVVYPISAEVVDGARGLLESLPSLSSRDALHVAVMQSVGISRLISFDKGFDRVKGIRRIIPK